MFPIPWYVVVFLSIPQAFLLTKIGLKLYNLDISIRDCMIISILTSLGVYFILQLRIPYLNTIFMLIATTLLLYVFLRLKILYLAVAVLTGVIITGILEAPFMALYFLTTGNPVQSLEIYPWVNIVIFFPQFIIMIFMYKMMVKHHFFILNLGDRSPYGYEAAVSEHNKSSV